MSEKCRICGEPMPKGEEMFKFHGYSGDCPKPPLRPPSEEILLQFKSFDCKAQRTADPPQDCNWPFCGCDSYATKVLEMAQESGWAPPLDRFDAGYEKGMAISRNYVADKEVEPTSFIFKNGRRVWIGDDGFLHIETVISTPAQVSKGEKP